MSEHGAGSDLAAVADPGDREPTAAGCSTGRRCGRAARTSRIRSSCWREPAHWTRSTGMRASAQFIVQTSAPGITISPIVLMNGEHHFNEVTFDDVFVADGDVLGEIGDGWHQVTAELGFERSGPERILSTATLIFSRRPRTRERCRRPAPPPTWATLWPG